MRLFIYFVLFVSLITLRPVIISAATTEPEIPPPVTEPEDSGVCDREKYVCLGTFTQDMCAKISGAIFEDNICKIPKKTDASEGQFTIANYLHAWIWFLIKIGLAFAIIIFIVAGIMYMTSGQDPGKANLAKDMIFTTLSGLVLLFLSYFLISWII